MVKVSIIVPIYNSERYLERCIESLLNQTLKEIEIILVNDGSEDSSLEICKSYSIKDNRITIIDKHNQGVSMARNAGLKVAKGEYVGFVDADDCVDSEMYSKMYEKGIHQQTDIIVCDVKFIKNNHIFYEQLPIIQDVLIDEEIKYQYVLPLISLENLKYNPFINKRSVWQYLFKKDLVKDNNIWFKEGLPLGEDFIFNLEVIAKSSRMSIVKDPLYNYYIYETSATKKYRENLKGINEVLRETLKKKYIEAYGNNPNINSRLNILELQHALSEILNEYKSSNSFKIKRNNILYICNNKKVKKILSLENIYEGVSFKNKVFYFFIKNNLTTSLIFSLKINDIINKLF